VTRIHLDTDFGGDPDDACAMALLLGWPDVELVAVTTNLDEGGRRAGCAHALLELAGRADTPVAAGAGASSTTRQRFDSTWGDGRYWPTSVAPRPGPPGAALDLLHQSISSGVTVVATGACTNLALLEVMRPGALAGADVSFTGGWLGLTDPEMPPWGPEMDWNVQCDTTAAAIVAAAGASLTLANLAVSVGAHLRRTDVPRLAAAGPLGALLARQTLTAAAETNKAALARAHAALPEDLLNFHWDPVTAAVGLGWPGARLKSVSLRAQLDESGILRFVPAPDGVPTRVLESIDAEAFREAWLESVERASARRREG
jgi:inosine-uridine nucleoside N-ribohydrolase